MRLREASGPLQDFTNSEEERKGDGGVGPKETLRIRGRRNRPDGDFEDLRKKNRPGGNFEDSREKNRPGGEWKGRWCIWPRLRGSHLSHCAPWSLEHSLLRALPAHSQYRAETLVL